MSILLLCLFCGLVSAKVLMQEAECHKKYRDFLVHSVKMGNEGGNSTVDCGVYESVMLCFEHFGINQPMEKLELYSYFDRCKSVTILSYSVSMLLVVLSNIGLWLLFLSGTLIGGYIYFRYKKAIKNEAVENKLENIL
ncbi:hypothetical protein DdX_15027 [Ditylenchus destructor]|uniref:Uncharacterized protein n=1 Tax=Ditylenchus destructor TaxID=166010 RepID=A0AAD4MVY8_9BILA|nr:hypothetical protein DdX_15027 [Ditylenchus destructor]